MCCIYKKISQINPSDNLSTHEETYLGNWTIHLNSWSHWDIDIITNTCMKASPAASCMSFPSMLQYCDLLVWSEFELGLLYYYLRTYSDDCTASVDCSAQKRIKLDVSTSRYVSIYTSV